MNRSSKQLLRVYSLFATVLAALGLASGCSSSTSSPGATGTSSSDLSGSYAGNITSGQSTCPGDWQVGQSAQVTVDAVQSGSAISLDVKGGAGLYVEVALGSSTFNGTVNGDVVSATLHGTAQQTDGNCTYTWAATFAGNLSGDTLAGTVTYAPVTNGGSDCTAKQIASCSEAQSFNGVRPSTGPSGLDGGVTVSVDASVSVSVDAS